ncbi:hypothetical protein JCM11491_004804 [Sporobolomyces phaffii]
MDGTLTGFLGLNSSTTAAELLPIPIDDVDLDTCKLLGPVALAVQAVMGAIVLGGLVIKRMREKPRRKWKIWLADVGKQVVGQFAVHLSNVAISDLIATTRSDNPCSLFALNILIDTTLGVLLIYFLLQWSTQLMQRYQPHYKTGFYGQPFSFSLWAEQAAVYVACLAVMKIVVLVIFFVAPELEDGMSWGLSWIENEEAQVVVVMLLLPLVMNLFQFLLVDSIIRSKDPSSPGVIDQQSDEESLRRGFLETGSDDEDDEGHSAREHSSRRGSARRSMDDDEEYSGLKGGDEDENGKQKEATELLFDADTPIDRHSFESLQARHSYPPSSANSNPVQLPPYSTLPPSNSNRAAAQPSLLPPNQNSGRDNKQSEMELPEAEEEEEDGWGESWTYDVDEDQHESIPLHQHQPLTPTPPKNLFPLPAVPPPTNRTHTPTPPIAPPSPNPPASHLSPPSNNLFRREQEEEEEDNDLDWGLESPSIPQADLDSDDGGDTKPDSVPATPHPTDRETKTPDVVEEHDDDGDDWGFDDSLSEEPPATETSNAVEKALGLDEAQLERQSTIQAPSEIGKELDGLS